ncbi:hypothetical protein Poli38472_008229 [Pythium oligandrum]|uniref:Cytochrome P450 n=1 Tax=Pythium oligandrum TaxID=41045 RepID=A0A8K1CLB9_PYTOL|nr:hypothetical protein Poli38472_008229 [Pythium oligandrum]|eukprot:TMW65587.1 hypothetical protein Poli38472_008229 [Pythium oligandrum]
MVLVGDWDTTMRKALAQQDNAVFKVAMALVVGTATLWLYRAHDQQQRKKRLSVDAKGNPRKLRELPRVPNALPLLGNMIEVIRNGPRIYDWTLDYCRKFKGEPWIRSFFGIEIVCFSTPDAVEEIATTQFENFIKGKFQTDLLEDLFGRGLVTADGERWYHQRKTAVKFFTARSLRAFMTQSMHKNIEKVCQVLEDGVKNDEWVDLRKLFQEFTLQTFVEMALGVEFDWIGTKESHPFYDAMDNAPMTLVSRFRRPTWWWKLARYLNVGPEAKLANEVSTIRTWMQEVLEKSLANLNEKPKRTIDGEEVKSVVELFVEQSEEDADGVRPEDFIDFLQTFMFASRDTTALTLTWLFYVLGQHPHVVQAIREEIKRKLPDQVGRKDVYLTTEHTRLLVYLEATIKEVLRLHPVAPTTMKKVVKDTVICGDIPLYEGQMVSISSYSLARNTDVWGPDASDFKPERWINAETGELIHVPLSKFFSFHAGPRTCVGMNLAMLELRVVLANLFNRFDFEIDPSNDGSYSPSPLLLMKHVLHAKIKPAPLV